MSFFRRYAGAVLLGLMVYGGSGVAAFAASDFLQIKGSDTMVNLGQAWAEEFMQRHPEVSIAVTGGGSGTGIAALINGTCDVAQCSRQVSEKELTLAKRNGRDIHEHIVGIDALAVVIHPDNPVEALSIEQLSKIFSGEITNWQQVGGHNQNILLLSRDRNSGTHVYFLEEIVRRGDASTGLEFAPSALMMPSSQAIVQEVASSRAAIGYIGIGYVTPQLKVLGISAAEEAPPVFPSLQTAVSGEYPIARPLYVYTPSTPEGWVQTFLEFLVSDDGQQIVEQMDFVPLSTDQRVPVSQ